MFTRGYAALRLYRIDAKGCATFVTMVDTGGPLAFVSIGEAPPGEMPELTIDTWLMHGDRRRTVFAWVSGRYVDVDPGEEIRGPRRIR